MSNSKDSDNSMSTCINNNQEDSMSRESMRYTLSEDDGVARTEEELMAYMGTTQDDLNAHAESVLEANMRIVHGFIAPPTDESDIGLICRGLAMDMVHDYVRMAEKEIEAVYLEGRFKTYYKQLMNEYTPQIEQHEAKLKDIHERIAAKERGEDVYVGRPKKAGEDAKIVTLFNVVETVKSLDGRMAIKEHKKLVTTAAEFSRMVERGAIVGAKNKKSEVTFGVIYGYTDIRELELDDFNGGAEIVMEHAPGIHEVITEQQFIDTATSNMGNAEAIKYRADNEIRYGRSQELFFDKDDSEDVKGFINAQKVTPEQIRRDVYQYGFRSVEEKRYHYNQIKDRFERHASQMRMIMDIGARAYYKKIADGVFKEEFENTADLVKLCAGTLFGGWVQLYDGDMKKLRDRKVTVNVFDRDRKPENYPNMQTVVRPGILKDMWTLPWNAMEKADRQELLVLYKKIKGEITKRNTAKQKVRAAKYEPLIEKMKNAIPVTKEEMKETMEYAEEEFRLNKRKIFTPTVYAAVKSMLKN